MDHEALRELQDALRTIESVTDGVDLDAPPGARGNEPDRCAWHPEAHEVHERINAVTQGTSESTTRTQLNLNELVATKNNEDVIVGLDAFAGNLCGIEEIHDPDRLRDAIGRGYGLERKDVNTLCDGPNWVGDARAWISPDQAIEAIFNVRAGKSGNEMWEHLNRDELCRCRDAEPRKWYTDQRFHQLYKREHAGAQEWPCQAREQELENEAVREEHRIARGAVIHPGAVIGREVTIEDGAWIEDGARVEPGTVVASNAVVTSKATPAHTPTN